MASPAGGRAADPANCAQYLEPYYANFFDSIDCGGARLRVAPGVSISQLGDADTQGWNNQIESATCGYDTTWNQACVLYDYSGYSGPSFWIWPGEGYYDLSF